MKYINDLLIKGLDQMINMIFELSDASVKILEFSRHESDNYTLVIGSYPWVSGKNTYLKGFKIDNCHIIFYPDKAQLQTENIQINSSLLAGLTELLCIKYRLESFNIKVIDFYSYKSNRYTLILAPSLSQSLETYRDGPNSYTFIDDSGAFIDEDLPYNEESLTYQIVGQKSKANQYDFIRRE